MPETQLELTESQWSTSRVFDPDETQDPRRLQCNYIIIIAFLFSSRFIVALLLLVLFRSFMLLRSYDRSIVIRKYFKKNEHARNYFFHSST